MNGQDWLTCGNKMNTEEEIRHRREHPDHSNIVQEIGNKLEQSWKSKENSWRRNLFARKKASMESKPDSSLPTFRSENYLLQPTFHTKQKIREGSPNNPRDVKILIGEFVSSTSNFLLRRVTTKFCSRVNRCIEAREGFFE